MSYLILKFREIALGYNNDSNISVSESESESDVIYGYKLSTNQKEDKTLILERVGDRFWKTRWISNLNSKKIIEPIKSLTSIFT